MTPEDEAREMLYRAGVIADHVSAGDLVEIANLIARDRNMAKWNGIVPTCNLKVEKNSRGVNYECTVVGAPSPDVADQMMRDLRARAEAIVNGEVEVTGSVTVDTEAPHGVR